jgi:proteasome lid subunit RPN8/RPN11
VATDSTDSTDGPVTLPQAFIDEMIAHAREDHPNECCGVILRTADGALKLLRATNAEASPFRFSIPPGELLHLHHAVEDEGLQWYVIYHSHTMTEARPSPTDENFSRMLQGPDPWPYWLLVSLADGTPSVRVWRMQDGEATERPLEAGPLPDGSTRAKLETTGTERKPVVTEVPL